MKPAIVGLSLMLVATAVAQTDNRRSIPVTAEAGPNEIAFSVIQMGSSSTYPEGGAFLLGTTDEWKDFLKKINDTGKHPVVDWKNQQLVVVQLAPSPSAARGFTVKRLRQKPGEVDIDLILNKPTGAGVNVHTPKTVVQPVSPYEVIMTRRFDLPMKTFVIDN